MHLSLLSDACLSDLLDDSSAPASPSRQHLDGVLRGLCVAVALLLPIGISYAASAFEGTNATHAAGRP